MASNFRICFSLFVIWCFFSQQVLAQLSKSPSLSPTKAQDVAPGIKTAVSQNGLNYVASVGLEILKKILATLTIPNQSGDADTPIGHIDWDLTNIKLLSFEIGAYSIKMDQSKGLSLALANVEAAVTLDWHYRKNHWPHVSDHGSADISVSGATTSVSLIVSTQNSRPHVQVASDNFNIGDLKIKLHGGASWLYDLFIKVLSHTIKDAIDKAVTDAITKNIDNGVNKALGTLPIEQHVNHQVEIDFPLVANPLFSSSFLTISQLGEFYEIAKHSECPSPHYPLPDDVTGQMANIMIGDFVANSAGYVFFNLGELHITVTEKNLPSWSPIKLNTSSFEYILPQLYKTYPNLAMELKIYSSKPPTAVFASNGATVEAPGNCDVTVIFDNGTTADAFTLSGSVTTHGEGLLNGTTIYGSLSYLYANFTLASTTIGKFDVSVFDQLVNLFFSKGLIPAVNVILEQGFVIPVVDGITFVKPSIGWGKNYLYVATDIHYVPPE